MYCIFYVAASEHFKMNDKIYPHNQWKQDPGKKESYHLFKFPKGTVVLWFYFFYYYYLFLTQKIVYFQTFMLSLRGCGQWKQILSELPIGGKKMTFWGETSRSRFWIFLFCFFFLVLWNMIVFLITGCNCFLLVPHWCYCFWWCTLI